MSKKGKKTNVSMDLLALLELEMQASSERIRYLNLLRGAFEKEQVDHDLLEMLCDGMSLSNKMLREVEYVINSNPIVTPEGASTEQVILFKEDQQILEAIILTRSTLRQEMRRKKNISSFFH